VNQAGLENSLVAVKLDPETGALRSLKTFAGLELADTAALRGLNQYCYVPGRDPGAVKTNRVKEIEIIEPGPLVGRVRIISEAPGCKSLVQEVTVFDGLMKVQIVNILDKSKVREKESVHFAFPITVPGGTFHLDGGWGVVRPGADQLPGSCMDFFPTGRWADISNTIHGITWTTIESPLVEIGQMTDERVSGNGYRVWRDSVASGLLLYSYVMNNYWHTNYKADQEGTITFRYSLQPHGELLIEDVVRFGVGQREPLIALAASGPAKADNSLFEMESNSILAISTKPVETEGALLLCLYNPTAIVHSASLQWNRNIPVSFHASDAFGRSGEPLGGGIQVPAYGTVFVRVNRK
jgi:hypothetical protein